MNGDFEPALANFTSALDSEGQSWTAERLQLILDAYHADHDHLCLDPNARNVRHISGSVRGPESWRAQQMLVDRRNITIGWRNSVDLPKSAQARRTGIDLRRIEAWRKACVDGWRISARIALSRIQSVPQFQTQRIIMPELFSLVPAISSISTTVISLRNDLRSELGLLAALFVVSGSCTLQYAACLPGWS